MGYSDNMDSYQREKHPFLRWSAHTLITYVYTIDTKGYREMVGDIYKAKYGWSFAFYPPLGARNGWRPTYKWAKAVSARRIKKAMNL